jgi:hypothetical protein
MNNKYIAQVAAKLLSIEHQHGFHEDSILALFALIRQHLEANDLQEQYKITNFYCNWCLHDSLDRNPVAKETLREISAVIAEENTTSHCDRISEIISIAHLRQELIEIAASVGVRSSLFNKHAGWKLFMQHFIRLVINKPIRRIEDPPTHGRFAQQLILETEDISTIYPDLAAQNSFPEMTVCWKVLVLPKGYYLVGPLAMTEYPSDFE